MNEVGEQPIPQEYEDHPPRLEDMEEFKKLSPEQQERLLALRERLMEQAMNPQEVVTRSIDEMGFWEGMKETVKPHLKKQKEILVKELKANASLAISLVPVLGEGKGVGTGLLGISAKEGKALTAASKIGDIHFEPIARLSKAGAEAKKAFGAVKAEKATAKLLRFKKTEGSIFTRIVMKAADSLDYAGAAVKDAFRPVVSVLEGRNAALSSLGKSFTESAEHGAGVLSTKLGVEGVRQAQKLKAVKKMEAYVSVKDAVRRINAADKKWYRFPVRWARSAQGEIAARIARGRVGKEFAKGVNVALEASATHPNRAVRVIEKGVKRMAPTAIEATKFSKFHAFFEKWLDLTPDVPHWISTTTGVLEFLGAHGIDAIPAMMQMGINRYKSAMVGKDMAIDVLKYTATRGLRKLAERKAAAQVFPQPAVVPAAA